MAVAVAQVQQAQAQSAQAQAQHELKKALYQRELHLIHPEEVASAQAEYRAAPARYQQVKAGASPEELAAAQAQLDLARSGPRPEDVAVAEAQLQQASTTLARARQALAQAQLAAPFDGTVSAVYLHPGEWAAAVAPVIELLDTGRWRVETRNIGELSIGQVEVGQDAIVRVIAFHGETLHGRVVAISPVAVVQQGDTTYTVMIELEPSELNLRPGMNAEVQVFTR